MNKSIVELEVWAAIIVAVTLLGRWAFSVDTHAQEDGELGQGWAWLTPTPTPTPEVKKKEEPPDCEDPGNSGYPECQGYVPIADRTATAEARQTAAAEDRAKTATAIVERVRATQTARARAEQTAQARADATATAAAAKTATAIYKENRRATATAAKATRTARETAEAIQTAEAISARQTAAAISAEQTAAAKTATAAARPGPGPGPRPGPNPDPPTPTPTPTFTPTPTPVTPACPGETRDAACVPPVGNPPSTPGSPFTVTVSISDGLQVSDITSTDSTGVSILDVLDGHTPLFLTIANRPTHPYEIASHYDFLLDLNSASTGFYFVKNGEITCPPNAYGDTTAEFNVGAVSLFNVVRCGLGTFGNQGFILKGRKGDSGPYLVMDDTGKIPQAWHQDNTPATYALDLASPYGSTHSQVSNYYTQNMRQDIERVSGNIPNQMNRHIGRTALQKGASGSADIVVKLYWDNAGVVPGCSDASVVGCMSSFDGQPYPHLYNQVDLWLRLPPQWFHKETGKWSEWTDNVSLLRRDRTGRRYKNLAFALMHEFGHTLGIRPHLPNGHVMGSQEYRYRPTVPSPNDLEAMKELTTPHTHGGGGGGT